MHILPKKKKFRSLGVWFSSWKVKKENDSDEAFLSALKAWRNAHKNQKYCQSMI